jgi:hypothetical protein
MKQFLIRITVFALTLIVFLEIFFRFVIPASDQPFYYQDTEYRVLRFDTNQNRSGLFTDGRTAQIRAGWNVNDAGWNANIEYFPRSQREKLMVAVIGDSYIEGFYIPWKDNVCHLIQEKMNNQIDVYAFGASGVPLPQYTNIMRYVKEIYSPDIYILFVNEEDLLGSIANFVKSANARQYKLDSFGKITEKQPIVKTANRARFLRRSATVRYLIANAGLTLGIGARHKAQAKSKGRALISKEDAIATVAPHIVNELSAAAAGVPVLFLVDGNRWEIYANPEHAKPLPEAVAFDSLAAQHGLHVLDLHSTFLKSYQQTGVMLNFKENYHWNALANELAAKEVSKILPEILPN